MNLGISATTKKEIQYEYRGPV